MFDVGFSELLVIGVIALVVFGPEDLPRVARTVGHLLGKMRRYVADVKAEIGQEMEMAELRRLQSEVQESVQSIQTSVEEQVRGLSEEFHALTASESESLPLEPLPQAELALAADAEPALEPGLETSRPETTAVAHGVDENQLDLFGAVEQVGQDGRGKA